MSFTRSQILEYQRNACPATAATIAAELARAGEPKPVGGGVAAFRGIDRTGLGPYRSKTESLYARRLDLERAAGRVLGWDYESDRLKLADPLPGGEAVTRGKWMLHDFTVYLPGGLIAWDQVKGAYATQAGMERFRWLCERYRLRWMRLWEYAGGAWRLKYESGRPALTDAIARAAATDAGERSARAAGRKAWDAADYDAAVREYDRLAPHTERDKSCSSDSDGTSSTSTRSPV